MFFARPTEQPACVHNTSMYNVPSKGKSRGWCRRRGRISIKVDEVISCDGRIRIRRESTGRETTTPRRYVLLQNGERRIGVFHSCQRWWEDSTRLALPSFHPKLQGPPGTTTRSEKFLPFLAKVDPWVQVEPGTSFLNWTSITSQHLKTQCNITG